MVEERYISMCVFTNWDMVNPDFELLVHGLCLYKAE
jgi:hypothetical protein